MASLLLVSAVDVREVLIRGKEAGGDDGAAGGGGGTVAAAAVAAVDAAADAASASTPTLNSLPGARRTLSGSLVGDQ